MTAGKDIHGGEVPGRGPLWPGVHREEIFPAPAQALETGVPVFVGFTEQALMPADRLWTFSRISRWEQFRREVGFAAPGSFLAHAVRGFFENGGNCCVVASSPMPEDGISACKAGLWNLIVPGGRLEDVDNVDLVCVPDLMMLGIRESRDEVVEFQRGVLEYCRRMGDRFAVLDALPVGRAAGDERAMLEAEMSSILSHWHALLRADGALYFPWIAVNPLSAVGAGPVGQQTPGDALLVPPCGHVAGVYARTDGRIGVHKAPANEVVEGVVDLEIDASDPEHALLTERGVNCLRALPGRGIRVMGARTLNGPTGWRYVNVRRLFLTVRRWIDRNMEDLVFEPHTPALWERIRQRLGAYCYELLLKGAIKGRSASEAYFVKCDAELNPPEVRESGRVVTEVGLAAEVPAEFIIVRITQSVAGITVGEPTVS